MRPSDHIITDAIKMKMRELGSAVEARYKDDVTMFDRMDKRKFEMDYKKAGMIVDVMSQDPRFKEQVK